ncbi:MAG: PAS domain S-box protein [Candidatus Schekmanbacteria bacterium]|nr:PAS domain S-box protein [Candidatus Schekmanbacteria bacterium]
MPFSQRAAGSVATAESAAADAKAKNQCLQALEDLFAESSIGLIATAPDGNVDWANQAAADFLGCELRSLLAPPVTPQRGPIPGDAVAVANRNVALGQPAENARTDSGHKHPPSLFPAVTNAIKNGPLQGYVLTYLLGNSGAARDSPATDLLLKALEATANGVVISDANGVIVWANPAFLRLTGYRLDQVMGRNPRFLKSGLHSQDFYQELWSTITAGEVWSGEMINRRRDGSLYVEDQMITPISDGGAVNSFVAIKQDVTMRWEAEAARKNALEELEKANALKTEFLANVTHDLKSPIGAILGSCDNILDGLTGPIEAQTRHFIEIARRNALRLRRQVDDLLDLSLIESGSLALRLAPTNLTRMIAMLVEDFRAWNERPEIKLAVELPSTDILARIDSRRICQVVDNLLSNAARFAARRIRLSLWSSDDEMRIVVDDDGPGVRLDDREAIFQRFGRASAGNDQARTGIGLSIGKQVVELHGGRIWVENEPAAGERTVPGARFIISLPSSLRL